MSPLSFLIVICVFLVQCSYKFAKLVDLLKDPTIGFIYFSLLFLFSISLISILICYFFPSVFFGLICPFSNFFFLRWKLILLT